MDFFTKRAVEVLASQDLVLDANETAFLERELTQMRVKAFEVEHEQLMARRFCPLATDIARSANTYTYKVWDFTGQAKVIANGSDDLPRVDTTATEITGKVYPIGASWGWELNELEEAIRTRQPLNAMKSKNARYVIELGIDNMLAFGHTGSAGESSNLVTTGLLNNTAIAGAGDANVVSLTNFTNTTDPDVILAALNAMVTPIITDSKQTFIPDTMLLDTTHYNVIATTKVGVDNDQTILRSFLANNPYIKSVEQWFRCDGIGANSTGRALTYKKSAEVLEAVIPQEFEQLPPQARNLEFIVNCTARCGGVKVHQPLAARYGDFAA